MKYDFTTNEYVYTRVNGSTYRCLDSFPTIVQPMWTNNPNEWDLEKKITWDEIAPSLQELIIRKLKFSDLDSVLQTRIITMEDNISTNTANILVEKNARINADQLLQNQVDSLKSRMSSAESRLTVLEDRMDEAERQIYLIWIEIRKLWQEIYDIWGSDGKVAPDHDITHIWEKIEEIEDRLDNLIQVYIGTFGTNSAAVAVLFDVGQPQKLMIQAGWVQTGHQSQNNKIDFVVPFSGDLSYCIVGSDIGYGPGPNGNHIVAFYDEHADYCRIQSLDVFTYLNAQLNPPGAKYTVANSGPRVYPLRNTPYMSTGISNYQGEFDGTCHAVKIPEDGVLAVCDDRTNASGKIFKVLNLDFVQSGDNEGYFDEINGKPNDFQPVGFGDTNMNHTSLKENSCVLQVKKDEVYIMHTQGFKFMFFSGSGGAPGAPPENGTQVGWIAIGY